MSPLYNYSCSHCDYNDYELRDMKDRNNDGICPKCGKETKRGVENSSFKLVGSDWESSGRL